MDRVVLLIEADRQAIGMSRPPAYQSMSPSRSTNRPDPAPGPSVASATIASVPSVTVCGPLWPFRSVAV